VLLATGLFVCFGAVGVRLVWLHVVDRDSLTKNLVTIRSRIDRETARRGDILDHRGARLATSRSVIELGVDPWSLEAKDEKKWPQLAALIGMPLEDLRRKFLTKYKEPSPERRGANPPTTTLPGVMLSLNATAATPAIDNGVESEDAAVADDTDDSPTDETGRRRLKWVVLCDEISESKYAEVLALKVDGVYGLRNYRRSYPSNELASHIIGYVNREQKPISGVERFANFYLRGQDGWRVGEKDAIGRELAQFRTREVPRADGYSVSLSIDLTVQDIIEQELAAIVEKYEPLKATIIVSRPRTGFILGMANYPTFNPNEYNKVPKDEFARMKNVAVTDIYEPGSVFKIVSVAGALEEHLVYPQSVFDCALDKISYDGRVLKLPDEDHPMGELTVAEIVSHSSNKGAAQLGMKLGPERLYNYARAFGFGSRLGFPVGGEVVGMLNNYKKWYPIDITRIPMGHSIAATALQMHQAMCVIANDGVLLRPQVIEQVRDDDGEVIFRAAPGKIRDVISKSTAQLVAEMLMGVAKKGGTAPEAAIEGFDVAGKTGTTQKFVDGAYSKKHHVVSFIGFFPARDPQVAISVIVDDADHKAPNGVAYGAKVAGPSFKRIGERLIPILDIKPTSTPTVRPTLVATTQGGLR
jgi:cell division protein FtsI/penicillin-binding protein 2